MKLSFCYIYVIKWYYVLMFFNHINTQIKLNQLNNFRICMPISMKYFKFYENYFSIFQSAHLVNTDPAVYAHVIVTGTRCVTV